MSSLISIDTDKPLARIREDLPKACANHKFGVLNVHDLQQKLREKGLEFETGTLVFDVCNPQQAKMALEHHPDVAAVLPCRVAAYELPEGGRTRLITVRPTQLLGLFGALELKEVAAGVEKTLRAILEETAR